MLKNLAWIVSFLADIAQIITAFRSGQRKPLRKYRRMHQMTERSFEYRRLPDGFRVALKRIAKRD